LKKAAQTDDEWLKELSASDAYKGIDVRREFSKAQNWASVRNRKVSRRFFVNWLNKAESPMAIQRPQRGSAINYDRNIKLDGRSTGGY